MTDAQPKGPGQGPEAEKAPEVAQTAPEENSEGAKAVKKESHRVRNGLIGLGLIAAAAVVYGNLKNDTDGSDGQSPNGPAPMAEETIDQPVEDVAPAPVAEEVIEPAAPTEKAAEIEMPPAPEGPYESTTLPAGQEKDLPVVAPPVSSEAKPRISIIHFGI